MIQIAKTCFILTLVLSGVSAALAQGDGDWASGGQGIREQVIVKDPSLLSLSGGSGRTPSELKVGHKSKVDGPAQIGPPKRCQVDIKSGKGPSCVEGGDGSWCDDDSTCEQRWNLRCDPDTSSCVLGGRGQACNLENAAQQCLATNKRCDEYAPGKCVNGGAGAPCSADKDCPTKVCSIPGQGGSKCQQVGSVPQLTNLPCAADTDCQNLKACFDANRCGAPAQAGNYFGLCRADSDCKMKFCVSDKCVYGLPLHFGQKQCGSDIACWDWACSGSVCLPGASGVDCDQGGCDMFLSSKCIGSDCDFTFHESPQPRGSLQCESDQDCVN